MKRIENVLILERGTWHPDQVAVCQIVNPLSIFAVGKVGDVPPKDIITLPEEVQVAIEENWQKVIERAKGSGRDPWPGDTSVLAGYVRIGERLVLFTFPSNYKEGGVISFFAIAMVPVTSDGYLALQGPTISVSATIGGGVRVPGCTPPDTNIFPYIIEEMGKEFRVSVTKQDLTIIGLVDVKAAIASPHKALVVKVKLSQARQELKQLWQQAPEKWEGRLIFKKLTPRGIRAAMKDARYNTQSRLIMGMVAESELGEDFVDHWPRIL